MKIENSNLSGATVAGAGKGAHAQGPQRAASDNDSAQLQRLNDQVNLSDFASRISRALDANASRRAEKVEALAQAFRAGTYAPDPRAVSQKMVDASLGPAAGI